MCPEPIRRSKQGIGIRFVKAAGSWKSPTIRVRGSPARTFVQIVTPRRYRFDRLSLEIT